MASDFLQINAGVPQGSVLSRTFFLHVNDMLAHGNIHGCAGDSTVHWWYFEHSAIKLADDEESRQELVAELYQVLSLIIQ